MSEKPPKSNNPCKLVKIISSGALRYLKYCLCFCLEKLQKDPRSFVAIILFIVFTCVILLALVPGEHPFEARMLVSKLSFTSNEPEKLFLNHIQGVEEISIVGKHEQPLIISGQFTGERFQGVTELAIELPYKNSQLILRPIPPKKSLNSDMELTALYLQNHTVISEVSYQTFSRSLNLAFEQKKQNRDITPNFLKLYVGNHLLEVVVEGYRIPRLNLEDSTGSTPLTISYQPRIREWQQQLPTKGSISTTLPDDTEAKSETWFWGNIDVNNVQFIDVKRTGRNFNEEIMRSTILNGTLRMVEEELPMESDQFLLVNSPGIQRLTDLKIQSERGIEVSAVGKTSKIQVGIDPTFPIRGIHSNVLTQIFDPSAMIAIVSFSGAMIASLLSWFISNLFKSSDKNK